MRKRILSVLLAGCLLLSVGCSARENDSAAETTEASSEVTINTYHETMPVPEDGWTAEKIYKVLYINGKQISLPCTIAELGDGFHWNAETYSSFAEDNEGMSTVYIKYNNEKFGLASNNAKYESELSPETIIYSIVYDGSELAYFNGITTGNSLSESVAAFGEGEVVSKVDGVVTLTRYTFQNCTLLFFFDAEIITKISLKLTKE